MRFNIKLTGLRFKTDRFVFAMSENRIKILLVDDESDILEFLKYNFEKEGYKVYTASDGVEGKRVALKVHPDLMILDIMMPGMDGIGLCNTLKEMPDFKDTIVIFLTARGEDYSQIAGFNAGADDYIIKPVKIPILMARVKALLKRHNKGKQHEGVTVLGNLIIDKERRIIILNGSEIALPKKEFNILLLLTSRPGKIFTREEIYIHIWGRDVYVGDRTLDVHIRKLREKLDNKMIKTVKGIGYGVLI